MKFIAEEMVLQEGDIVKFTTGTIGEFIDYLPKRAKFKVTDLKGITKVVVKKLAQIEEVLNESLEQSASNPS